MTAFMAVICLPVSTQYLCHWCTYQYTLQSSSTSHHLSIVQSYQQMHVSGMSAPHMNDTTSPIQHEGHNINGTRKTAPHRSRCAVARAPCSPSARTALLGPALVYGICIWCPCTSWQASLAHPTPNGRALLRHVRLQRAPGLQCRTAQPLQPPEARTQPPRTCTSSMHAVQPGSEVSLHPHQLIPASPAFREAPTRWV